MRKEVNFFCFLAPLLLGVASHAHDVASSIDVAFKAQRLQAQSAAAKPNELYELYSSVLSRSMASRCRWYPSDSQFLKLKSQRCGPLKGTVLAVSRFMMESDADALTNEMVIVDGMVRFVDFGGSCDVF